MPKLFDLIAWMRENGEDISSKLGIKMSDIAQILNSGDENAVWRLWDDYVRAINDETLFPVLMHFYSEFNTIEIDLEEFIKEILAFRDCNIPRKMVNSIERLITIADKMDLIEKGHDALKVFFIVVTIETLHTLIGSKCSKTKMVTDFFKYYLSEPEQRFILDRVKRNYADNRFKPGDDMVTDIDIELFARILNEVRNKFAHEGNYFEFSFARGDNVTYINSIKINESFEENKSRGRYRKEERVYNFQLKYCDFRVICVNGLIRFVKEYFDSIQPSALCFSQSDPRVVAKLRRIVRENNLIQKQEEEWKKITGQNLDKELRTKSEDKSE